MRNKSTKTGWNQVAVRLVVGDREVTTEWSLAWEKIKPMVRKARKYGFVDRLATIMWEEI